MTSSKRTNIERKVKTKVVTPEKKISDNKNTTSDVVYCIYTMNTVFFDHLIFFKKNVFIEDFCNTKIELCHH